MTDFLPQGYKEPNTNKYMKFVDGQNTFRVLSKAIVGNEFWKEIEKEDGTIGRTPIRRRMSEQINNDEIGTKKDGSPDFPKHFWAFVVYNWNDDAIQILEITQSGIRLAIKALVDNSKWGDPKEYNIVVTRIGEGFETKYNVQPEPKEKLDKEIVERYEKMNINLEELFNGGDPFGRKNEEDIDISEVKIEEDYGKSNERFE